MEFDTDNPFFFIAAATKEMIQFGWIAVGRRQIALGKQPQSGFARRMLMNVHERHLLAG